MALLRRISEDLARKTSRRGLFGRGAQIATGALLGTAAGSLAWRDRVSAHTDPSAPTHCSFPGPACPCDGCNSNGVCAKPCIIMTQYYASGCWVSHTGHTCCDCDCNGFQGYQVCGCGSDYHNDPQFCPK